MFGITDRQIRSITYGLFFGSGFSGLVYEVVWVRILQTILGSTTYAVSIVLTAFMAGLAIGSFYAGRLIGKRAEALKIFGWIELGIGFFAFLSPVLLTALNPIYVWLHNEILNSFPLLNLVRFILSFAILIVPTAFMGATLPVLSKFFVKRESKLGTDIGGLYGFNTLGSMVGCFSTGFFLIEQIGVRRSIFLAALINLLIAAIIFILHRRFSNLWAAPSEDHSVKVKTKKETQAIYSTTLLRLVLLTFAVSGFVALGYEVLWTKAISFFAGNTSYAFSTMLTTFLCGLGVGSVIAMRFCDRMRSLLIGFGLAEILIGFCAILTIPMFARLFFLMEPTPFGGSEATPVWLKFSYSFLAMLLPTLIMGAIFPLVSKIYTRSINQIGRSIGNIYSINTTGAILGSAVAGFVLIPLIGIQKSILLLATVNIVVGIILIACSPEMTFKRKCTLLVPIVLFTTILTSIVPVSGKIFSSIKRPTMPRGNSIYYKEGVTHIVEILESKDGTRHLILDGGINASTASTGVGMRVHMLMAQLPLLLHQNPRSILLIALGSGMTAGATLAFGSLETIDCPEISPDVVKAANYFSKWNHNILNSPRFNLYIEDGRNFVLTTARRYDIITTGIIHPKHSAGNASLYSRQYYEICKSKLNKGGIICQWVPLNGLKVSEFKLILKTFQEVFPHSTLWFAQTFGSWGNSNTLLIGTDDELRIDYNKLEKDLREDEIASDLKSEGIHNVFELLDCFAMSEKGLAEYVSDQIEITTDDRPLLEFGSVEMHYAEILADLASKREPILPHLINVGRSSEDSVHIYDKLQNYFEVSNKCIQGDIAALRKRYGKALAEYSAALKLAPHREDVRCQFLELQIQTHKYLAESLLKQKDRYGSDIEQYLQLLEVNPDDAEALFRTGYLYQKLGWLDAAIFQYEEALKLEPDNLEVRHNLAVVYDIKGWTDKAIEELEIVVRMNPSFSEPYAYLGFIYERLGNTSKAIELFEKALKIDPTNQTVKKHLSKLKGA